MHWELIAPLIALAIWILLSLFKPSEEPPKQVKPGEPLPADSPPRPQSEVDKFLEEINRMRRRQEEEQRQQQEQRRQPEPRQRTEPVPPPPPPVVVQAEPTTAPNFENPTPPATIPQVERPRARPVKPRRPEPKPTPVKPPAPVAEATPARPSVRTTVPKASPAVAQLHGMLRSPQSVQAAILLREVLGPPRCRRRR